LHHYEYPDEQTLRRMLLAPAGVATLVGPEREDAVRAQIVDAMAPYRTGAGRLRLNDEVHFLVPGRDARPAGLTAAVVVVSSPVTLGGIPPLG
jgi:hypothetical protein